MKKLLAAFALLVATFAAWGASTEPGGVVDQNNQSRGTAFVVPLTITTGGVSQTAITANQFRKFVMIQNPSTATESIFVNFDGTAASNTSLEIAPGRELVFESLYITTSQFNVFAATTGHKFTVIVG